MIYSFLNKSINNQDDLLQKKLEHLELMAKNNSENLYSIQKIAQIFGRTEDEIYEGILNGDWLPNQVLIEKGYEKNPSPPKDKIKLFIHPYITTHKTLARYLNISIEKVHQLEKEGKINPKHVILKHPKNSVKNV